MLWFTSDTHFFHANIIKHCSRPFEDRKTMNAVLVQKWNSRVRPEDDVWFLGDFSFGSRSASKAIFDRLNGNKHLVWGNHDPRQVRTRSFGWKSVQSEAFLRVGGAVTLHLYHYPIEDWRGKFEVDALHLHGHSHGTARKVPLRLDVGVDCHDFEPISMDRVLHLARESRHVGSG